MPLIEVAVPRYEGTLPETATALIAAARRRVDDFLDGLEGPPAHAFVPSDYEVVYRTLRGVSEQPELAPGRVFVEWGSGFGVVAALAAMLGFRSHGIEIERGLVAAARRLCADFGQPVAFAEGTFIPEGGESFLDVCEDLCWLAPGGACGHERLGLEPDEVDVVFAYPWPGEERPIEELFAHFAADGALLVLYRGIEGIQVQRKQRGRRSRIGAQRGGRRERR